MSGDIGGGLIGGGDRTIGTVVSVSTLMMVSLDWADMGRSMGESTAFGVTGGDATIDLDVAESGGEVINDLDEGSGDAITDLIVVEGGGDATTDLEVAEGAGEAEMDLESILIRGDATVSSFIEI